MAMVPWKKMAEAFGRAVRRPGTGTRGKPFGEAAERVGAGFEFNHGRWQGDMAEEEAAKKTRDFGPEYQKEFDNAVEEQTDERLKADFDEAFDRALKGAANRQYTTNNRRDMLGTVNDIEDDFREQAIEMLKEGKPIEDVLDILKQTGYQRPKLGRVSSGE